MPRVPIEEAIGRIREAGFRAIEVVPVKVEHDPTVEDWLDHPFRRDTALDDARMTSLVAKRGYDGPLMLEIPADPEMTIFYC